MTEFLGWIICIIGLIGWCVACWRSSSESSKIDRKKSAAERKHEHHSRMIKDPVFVISISIGLFFLALSLWLAV